MHYKSISNIKAIIWIGKIEINYSNWSAGPYVHRV